MPNILKQINFEKSTAAQIILIFTLSMALRIVAHSIFPVAHWPDSYAYLADGESITSTWRMASNVYMPLYPILLGLTGENFTIIIQIIASSATSVIIYLLSKEITHSQKSALISGLIASTYPLLIFFSNAVLTETIYIFMLFLALMFWQYKLWWLAAAAMVLGILVRPVFDYIAPVLIILFMWSHGENINAKNISRRLIQYFTVYVTLMSPWWVHNYMMYGRFVRLNLADGVTMRLENNPVFDNTGLDFQRLLPGLKEISPPKSNPVDENSALKKAALDYALSDPLHYLKRCVERFGRFWSPSPGSEKVMVNAASIAASVPIFIGAVLFLMTIRSKQQLKNISPYILLIAFLTAVHSATHALFRYRLPIDPILIIFAGNYFARFIPGKFTWKKAFQKPSPTITRD